jgi:integrin alpha FG-GAP repeat containing protein 1
MGIGRSNNYVETFFAATSIKAQRASHMWTPLIPNSQLVLFANSAETEGWSLELFINPTQSLFIIVIVCVCLLVVLGIIIIGLHCKEKREDEANKDKTFEFM